MNSKKVVTLLSVAFLLFLAFSCSTAVAEETRIVFTYEKNGISVRVYAPYQAYPGDYITVRVRVKALVALDDISITIMVFGSKSLGYDSWDKEITADVGDLDAGKISDEDYRFRVPSDSDPGLIYGHIDFSWETPTVYEYDDSFIMTYLKNKAYEGLEDKYNDLLVKYNDLTSKYNKLLADYNDLVSRFNSLQASYTSLKKDYDSLNASYYSLKSSYEKLQADHKTLVSDYGTLQGKFNALDSSYKSLLADYDSLKANYTDLSSRYEAGMGELGNTRNLMYVFVVTTVVFVATTVIFVLRRPRAIG